MITATTPTSNSISNEGGSDIAITMTMILSTLIAILIGLINIQDKPPPPPTSASTFTKSSYYPCPKTQPSKHAYEKFCTYYSPIWMSIFTIIVAFKLYEDFTAITYNIVCLSCALPFLLQPILIPSTIYWNSPDQSRPLTQRYATKANLWIAVYSFIGNYWYTHYFYSVLKASYSMPSTRLNNVPIAMFFATHFYFSSYHVFSNVCLRKIKTTFVKNSKRRVLYVFTVLVLSYFTAFMETLTISSFPYYSFEDRDMAYKLGSAFYGIYFIVSFPAFLEFDEDVDGDISADNGGESGDGGERRCYKRVTCWDTLVESCGYGMIILCLLDFVRLFTDIPLIVGKLD